MALEFPNLDGVTNLDEFIKAYRQSLAQQYDANRALIDNTRNTYETSLMGAANARGMMYSNFPQRQKMQYQMDTYMPNVTKAKNTYQTGIDKLRSTAVDVANEIRTIEQAIADLNQYGTSGGSAVVQ